MTPIVVLMLHKTARAQMRLNNIGILFCTMLLGLMCGSTFAADDFALLKSERIGNLRIGQPEDEVKKIIQCPLKQGIGQFWDADGAYHQEWKFIGCGITVGMVSEREKSPKTIAYISVKSPNPLKTLRGIHIGSTEKDVINAYKADWDLNESKASTSFVAGSIYGGVIFEFKQGKVSSIFLGAAAE